MSIKYNGGYIPAVGADGTTLVANSASATGVAWAGPTFAAGKTRLSTVILIFGNEAQRFQLQQL